MYGRAAQALKISNPAAYYSKYVAPNLDRPGMAGAAANVERQRLLKTITNQAVNPGLDIRPSPGATVVAMAPGNVPIYGQAQAQAASAPAPAPSAPAPSAPSTAELRITKEAEAYRKEAEAKLAEASARIKELEDEDLQAQKAKELQERLAIVSAANRAREGLTANLQIAPASQTPSTAGTQAFKRRRMQFIRPTSVQTTSKLNVPTSSVLNI